MSRRALIGILLLASTAHAESKWDAAYAYGANLETIGGDGYAGMLLQIQVARRVTSRIAIAGTAELATAASGDIEGGVARGLAGVDFRLLGTQRDFTPTLVASVGTGTETIAWDRGTLTRGLSYAGIEYRMAFQVGTSGFFRNLETFGFRFGVRAHVAPGPTGERVAKLCTACEQMDPPDRGIDVGVAIYMGLIFGR